MLKVLQVRLQQYMNRELLDVQAGFRKGRGIKRSNSQHPLDHKKKKNKRILFVSSSLTDYAKALNCVNHNKLCKILKEMGMPDHLTYLLRNLYAHQEATVRTGHGTTD